MATTSCNNMAIIPGGLGDITEVAEEPDHSRVSETHHVNVKSVTKTTAAFDKLTEDSVSLCKKYKARLKDAFLAVHGRSSRQNSEDSSAASPAENRQTAPYSFYGNYTSGGAKITARAPSREISYEEELQQRQQQLMDAMLYWQEKYKDLKSENNRLITSIQQCEENCIQVFEGLNKDFNETIKQLKVQLSSIIDYADEITRERNTMERDLRQSLRKAREQTRRLDTRISADRLEIQRLRSLCRRIELDKDTLTTEHNRLKEENHTLQEKVKILNSTETSPSPKIDEMETVNTRYMVQEKGCDNYALLLEMALQQLQVYEERLRNQCKPCRRTRQNSYSIMSDSDNPLCMSIVSSLSDCHKISVTDPDDVFSDSPTGSLKAGTVDSMSLDSVSPDRTSDGKSMSDTHSETDSDPKSNFSKTSPRNLSDDHVIKGNHSPQTHRSQSSLDKPTLERRLAPSLALQRSSSEHDERSFRPSVTSMISNASSTHEEKPNTASVSSFGVLRQRRGGIVNIPPEFPEMGSQKGKKQTWGRDLIAKMKKKNINVEKNEDKQGVHFWHRSKSRSVKERGEKQP